MTFKVASGVAECAECGQPTPSAGVALCPSCASQFETAVGQVLGPLDGGRVAWLVECEDGRVVALTLRVPGGEPVRLPRSALERIARLLVSV